MSSLSLCPICGTTNNFLGASTEVPKKMRKRTRAKKAAVPVILAIVAVIVTVLLMPTLINIAIFKQENNPIITILQPDSQNPKFTAHVELVQHALELINKDREKFGLAPVKLSSNQAAQMHAEDVFKTKQISHWTTNGEKPYMTYTDYGGKGNVQQNVAIAGFTQDQYNECETNILLNCEKIDPMTTIDKLENEMVYNDQQCCDNGHRDNILDGHHTHVSIGIAYDQYYLAFVENFENNYGLEVTINNGQVRVSGNLSTGTLDYIGIYYDTMPTPEVYEQNKHLLSYSAGDIVANVVKPLPPGYYYKAEGYKIIEANKWNTDDNHAVNVDFNLASAVRKDGVYTLFATVEDGREMFDVTSYSIYVKSQSNNNNSTDR
jgi:uncharacterized protein YkwD